MVMNSKSNVLRVITWILAVFNVCATVYYIVNSHQSNSRLKKMHRKLNAIKDELKDITDEINELTDELNEELGNKDVQDTPTEDVLEDEVQDVADIDTVEENIDDEEVEE
jgi:septal ring factor EnvC (AmiA/AmiB activator)